MHFLDSFTFLVYLSLGIVAYQVSWRVLVRVFPTFDCNWLLLPVSAAGIIGLLRVPPLLLLGSVLSCIGIFLVSLGAQKRNSVLAMLLIAVVTLLWAVARFPHVFGRPSLHEKMMPLIGVSFIFCKMVSFIVDECIAAPLPGQQVERPKLIQFLVYIFYFPSWLAGPLSKYSAFKSQRPGADYWYSSFFPGVKRVIIGTIKRNLFVEWMAAIALPFIPMAESSKSRLVLGVYAYYAFLYLDFSGYCDTAIGISRIVGITLPENFDRPYLARNVQDFWNRWHISFTKWLFEYIFVPTYSGLLKISARADRVFLSGIALLVTFTFSGVWHGEGNRFILYGIYHGVGFFAFRQLAGRTQSKANESGLAIWFSRFVTFHYVLVGFIIYSVGFTGLRQLISRLLGA